MGYSFPMENIEADNAHKTARSEAKVGRSAAAIKACLSCREKHLKCDGLKPCSRCLQSGSGCVFIASRRGLHSSRRKALPVAHQQIDSVMAQTATSASYSPPTDGLDKSESSSQYSRADKVDKSLEPGFSTCTFLNDPDPAITAFYYYFFPSHPFVLPRNNLSLVERVRLRPVLAAIRWIGSLYLEQCAADRPRLLEEAQEIIHSQQTPRDGYFVQATLLLLVALDGYCERQTTLEMLNDAERLALEIKLNSREFAVLHGHGTPVVEESWRRTWWELYIVDGLIAGVHRQTNFALWDADMSVLLPCEEDEYLSGYIPPPSSLQDLEDKEFSDGLAQFSSYSYRILSVRNVGHLIRLPATASPMDPVIQKVDTLLTNWKLHVPPWKQDALQRDGSIDEMMFQAYMMTHAVTIMLHEPFSRQTSRPVQAIDACAPPKPVRHSDTGGMNAHLVKVLASASEISSMVTTGAALLSHTHFFTCVLTVSSIVHLSRWASVSPTEDDEDVRQRIRTNMGALEKRAAVWPAARRANTQITAVAKQVYQARKERQAIEVSIWGSLSEEAFIYNDETLSLPPELSEP